MKRTLILLSLLACACAPPAPAQHARVETLVARNGRLCTADGAWCVVAPADDATDKTVRVMRVASGDHEAAAFAATEDGDNGSWDKIIRLADGGVIVGVTTTKHDMYSGGGGEATELVLYRLAADASEATPQAAATIPFSGQFDIRACFSEADTRNRHDACSDQYDFAATLAMDETSIDSPPRLTLSTEATTFPGRRSRDSDSTRRPALGPNDLVKARDETCSYHRTLTWNESRNRYDFDTPLPACDDYKTQS